MWQFCGVKQNIWLNLTKVSLSPFPWLPVESPRNRTTYTFFLCRTGYLFWFWLILLWRYFISSSPLFPWLWVNIRRFIPSLSFFCCFYLFVNRIIWRQSQKLMMLTQLVYEQVFFCFQRIYYTYQTRLCSLYSLFTHCHIPSNASNWDPSYDSHKR